MRRLWFLLLTAIAVPLLAVSATGFASSPSFDCSKAASAAEKAVCASETLAALDQETARLYKLALNGPHMTAERRKHLKTFQRGWIKGRDDCWKSDDGLESCVTSEYTHRIHGLREGYADARSGDAGSGSIGPFAYACDGLNAALSVVFITADPARYASLKWSSHAVSLSQAISASGARYVGSNFEGEFTFWIKGQEASFTRPGEDPIACKTDETG